MYTNLGYIIYRTILEYYSGDQDEDAYGKSFEFKWLTDQLTDFLLWFDLILLADMRKALSRDVNKKSVIPYTQPVRLEDIDMNWYPPTARIRIYV